MRKAIPVAIVLAFSGLLCWFLVHARSRHSLIFYTHYRHAQDVKKGTPVCVDGVQLGSVSSVIVRPEFGDRPIEVVLRLNPSYDLKIPVGSIAQIETQGVLGPPIVDIDTRIANGQPLKSGSAIEGREFRDDQVAHVLGVVVKALIDQSKQQDQQKTEPPANHR